MDDRDFWLMLRRALLMAQGDPGVQARPAIRCALAIAVGAINCRYNLGDARRETAAVGRR